MFESTYWSPRQPLIKFTQFIPSQMNAAKRKIYFYRINVGSSKNGSPVQFDADSLCNMVKRLPFEAGQRYMEHPDGDRVCMWVASSRKAHRIAFGRTRRSNLPSLEEQGRIRPLSVPAEAGVLEQTHVVFFENNIAGVLFNFHGPRVQALAQYIRAKSEGAYSHVVFEQLLRSDAIERLDELDGMTSVMMKVRKSHIQIIAEADNDLAAALDAAATIAETNSIELVVRANTRRQERLSARLARLVRELAGDKRRHGIFERLRVSGRVAETGQPQELDLLKDQLVVSVSVPFADTRHRQVDSEAAYSAIEREYARLRAELEEAASAEMPQ